MNFGSFCLYSLSAVMTGVCHHARHQLILFLTSLPCSLCLFCLCAPDLTYAMDWQMSTEIETGEGES